MGWGSKDLLFERATRAAQEKVPRQKRHDHEEPPESRFTGHAQMVREKGIQLARERGIPDLPEDVYIIGFSSS